MTNESELRMGNSYLFRNRMGEGDTYQRFEYWQDATTFLYEGEPIPLTPEILEGCGFERHYTDEKDLFFSLKLTKDLYNPLAIISTLVFDEDCPVGLFPNKCTAEIKHLHQLQNLYFALTGDELPIDKVEKIHYGNSHNGDLE